MTGLWVVLAAVLVAGGIAVASYLRDGRFRMREAQAGSEPTAAPDVLTAEELTAELGAQATLVQFSSSFCAPCRATRVLLTDVAAHRDDVVHVEVDAESRLDLVRRLGILRTPTVLVLDADGVVRGRASGVPRRDQVEAALQAVDSGTLG